jgi:hypothetical protein
MRFTTRPAEHSEPLPPLLIGEDPDILDQAGDGPAWRPRSVLIAGPVSHQDAYVGRVHLLEGSDPAVGVMHGQSIVAIACGGTRCLEVERACLPQEGSHPGRRPENDPIRRLRNMRIANLYTRKDQIGLVTAPRLQCSTSCEALNRRNASRPRSGTRLVQVLCGSATYKEGRFSVQKRWS